MPGAPPPGYRITSFRLPEELHRAARLYAALRGEHASDVFRRGLVQELTGADNSPKG